MTKKKNSLYLWLTKKLPSIVVSVTPGQIHNPSVVVVPVIKTNTVKTEHFCASSIYGRAKKYLKPYPD